MTTYRVWCETGDLCGEHEEHGDALWQLVQLRKQCMEQNGCDDSNCGVLYEHGYFIQEVSE